MIRPADILIILCAVTLIAALGMRVYRNAPVAALQVHGTHGAQDYPAWEDRRIRIDGPLGETVIELKAGRARVLHSPCRQKLCIRTGWLERAGEAAACVPNRVSLVLLGGDPRFDAVNF